MKKERKIKVSPGELPQPQKASKFRDEWDERRIIEVFNDLNNRKSPLKLRAFRCETGYNVVILYDSWAIGEHQREGHKLTPVNATLEFKITIEEVKP